LKTKKRSDTAPTVNLVGFDPVQSERIRASLGRSPFHFAPTVEPLSDDDADLFVIAAGDVGSLAEGGVPVIAHGPSSLMRAAFLAGCSDYLREPWTPEELALRAQAALSRRRACWEFPWGEARLKRDELYTPGGRAVLTHHEAVILRALLRQRGRPVPRTALACLLGVGNRAGGKSREGAGSSTSVESRRIDVQVSALRRRVRAVVPDVGRFIVCVRGQGYMIP
jgi:CheY-like chemotaxis protein